MDRWHLPQDFWTTIEKGVNHYTEQPYKRATQSKENEPQKPFGVTFNTPRNLLQQAFRTQSHTSDGTTSSRVESAGTDSLTSDTMRRIPTAIERARTGPRDLSEDYGNTLNDCGNLETIFTIKIMKER
jgi:hypothetical protein